MAFFQWQQIDPTETSLARAMNDAFAAADLNPASEETFASSTNSDRQSSAGSGNWTGLAIEGRPWGKVTFVWWTDAVGRRHCYLEGHEYPEYADPDPLWRCRNGQPPHPLWVIAPLHAIQSGEEPDDTFLVLCDCGEIGTPDSLGWMGTSCGPCHDRHAEVIGWTAPAPRTYHPHRSSITGLAFTEDGWIASCELRNSTACVCDPGTAQIVQLTDPVEGGAVGLATLPGGRVVVALSHGMVICADSRSGETDWRTECRGELIGLAVSPLGDFVAVDAVGLTYLLEVESGSRIAMSGDYSHFAFSHSGEVLYAHDYAVRAIVAIGPIPGPKRETGLEFGEPEEDDCYSLVCSPTGRWVASGGDHGRVRLGDTESGKWLWIDDGPSGLVTDLAFTPDGRVLASGHDNTVVIREVATGTKLGQFRIPGDFASSLAFSPEGDTLAVGNQQGVVRLLPWRALIQPEE